jgi:solute carrier family 35 protein C2
MDEQPTTNPTRRRSSSLVGPPGPSNTDSTKHRSNTRDKIPEEGEDFAASDSEHSDDSTRTGSTDLELGDMRSDDNLEDDEETGLTGRDRRRRRRRKRRNTHLDQRIVEDVTFTKEEEKLANANLLHDMLINAVLIGLW